MLFENVTDITIPQGNVIKIHEAVSGRVLWEKKSDVYTRTKIIYTDDISGSDRLIALTTNSVDETQLWLDNNSIKDASVEWYVSTEKLPDGLCLKYNKPGRAFLGISNENVIMPKGSCTINLLVIIPNLKIYDEGSVLFNNTVAGKKTIYRRIENYYIAPDISTAPEIKKAN